MIQQAVMSAAERSSHTQLSSKTSLNKEEENTTFLDVLTEQTAEKLQASTALQTSGNLQMSDSLQSMNTSQKLGIFNWKSKTDSDLEEENMLYGYGSIPEMQLLYLQSSQLSEELTSEESLSLQVIDEENIPVLQSALLMPLSDLSVGQQQENATLLSDIPFSLNENTAVPLLNHEDSGIPLLNHEAPAIYEVSEDASTDTFISQAISQQPIIPIQVTENLNPKSVLQSAENNTNPIHAETQTVITDNSQGYRTILPAELPKTQQAQMNWQANVNVVYESQNPLQTNYKEMPVQETAEMSQNGTADIDAIIPPSSSTETDSSFEQSFSSSGEQSTTQTEKKPEAIPANISDNTILERIDFSRGVIQISDASSSLEKTPVQQIADQVNLIINEDKTEYELQLAPESLGKISIKISANDGAISIQLIAQNPKTQELLNSSSSQIASLLKESGISQSEVVVTVYQSPDTSENDQAYQEQGLNQQQAHQQQQQNKQQEPSVDFESYLTQLHIQGITMDAV